MLEVILKTTEPSIPFWSPPKGGWGFWSSEDHIKHLHALRPKAKFVLIWLAWDCVGLIRTGTGWIALNSNTLDWVRLSWIGLDRLDARLGCFVCIGLNWLEIDRVAPSWAQLETWVFVWLSFMKTSLIGLNWIESYGAGLSWARLDDRLGWCAWVGLVWTKSERVRLSRLELDWVGLYWLIGWAEVDLNLVVFVEFIGVAPSWIEWTPRVLYCLDFVWTTWFDKVGLTRIDLDWVGLRWATMD